MLFVTMWVIFLGLFVVVSICCRTEIRKLWHKRLAQCRWNPTAEPEESQQPNEAADPQIYRFVMSRAQEDEIRESVLAEKLGMFSMKLDPASIKQNQVENDTSDTDETATSSDGDVEAPKARSNTCGTIDTTVSSEEGDQNADEFPIIAGNDDFDECTSLVTVPEPGCCAPSFLPDGATLQERDVPNGCAICLGEFDASDQICWSANANCSHVFHYACTLDWLMECGRKHLKRQRRRNGRGGTATQFSDPVTQVTQFPMLCPCCRQDFVVPADDDSISVKEETSNVASTVSQSDTLSNEDVAAHATADGPVGDENV